MQSLGPEPRQRNQHVRFESKADMATSQRDVRFTPKADMETFGYLEVDLAK
jgi:hypothetical protein